MALTHDEALRFIAQLQYDGRTGCWLWTGPVQQPGKRRWGGYGKAWLRGKTVLAHRVMHAHRVGPIPVGYTIDHVKPCPHRHCVRHTEAVTLRENVLRGNGWAARNARKTHCRNGHPFTAENTGQQKHGRFCRTCRRADYRRYRQRHKRCTVDGKVSAWL